jgi:alginate O-acetyltransferase complex protein AlgJ
MNAATFDKIRRFIRALLIACFLIVLVLPAADSFLRLDSTPPPNENRTFATFPKFDGVGKFQQFIRGIDGYFTDHFGFRKRLVTWNNEWKNKWFHEAPFSSVMAGRDGWLYLASYQMVEHYCGLSRFTPEDLSDWQKLLEGRRDWLAHFNTKYIFVIPPDKQSIYPEHLPEWLKKSDRPSKLDQFVEYMKAHSTVAVLDLRKPLLDASQMAQVYPLTDTHWNQYGAFIGCQEIIKALADQLPELHPLSLEQFARKPEPDRQGDLARLAGQAQMESKQFSLAPQPPLAPLQRTSGKAMATKRWPLPDPIITLNTNASGEAIVFRDSFGDNLIPFLGYHFKQVVFVSRFEWDIAFIEQEKPAVVIDELLERSFNTQNIGPMQRAESSRLALGAIAN